MNGSITNPFDIIIDRLKNIESLLINQPGQDCDSEYMKIDKAAEFLSTTANALRVMVHKNQIRYIKKQGKIFFSKSDLIEWLESGRVEQTEVHTLEASLIANNKKRP